MRQEIPLLNQIYIEKPCTANWDAMTAIQGEQVKHCAHCQKNVYNLSAMTEQDAENLLAQMPNLCVRYSQNDEGQILTEEVLPPSRSPKMPSTWLFRFVASVAAIVTGLIARPASADTVQNAKTPPKKPTKTQTQQTRHLIMGKRIAPAHTMGKPVMRKLESAPPPIMGEPSVTPKKDQTKQKPHSDLEKTTTTSMGLVSGKF